MVVAVWTAGKRQRGAPTSPLTTEQFKENLTMSFTTVSQLFNQTDIFVIPTFQRPYAWEKPQWDDLLRDLHVATARNMLANRPGTMHYFGAIHTIQVKPRDALLKNYIDANNDDIRDLRNCDFQTNTTSFKVHLVVDGQQRLITLLSLLECALHDPNRYIDLPNGRRIPKVILNPAADHAHWRHALAIDPDAGLIETRSQKRLIEMFRQFRGSPPRQGSDEYRFLIGDGFCLNWVQLPAGTSLSPFLTLNDRGKDLTKLEKVKGFAMEADDNFNYGLAPQLNTSFGTVYRSIDQMGSLLNEDDFLRHISIALWESLGISIHEEPLEALYGRYRDGLSVKASTDGKLVVDILAKGNELVEQHNSLVGRFANALRGTQINKPSFVNKLFTKAPTRDASDDYQMVLGSLGLQAKQLALLLATRARYGVDWHDSLGQMRLSNRVIRNELLNEFSIRSRSLPNDVSWQSEIWSKIDAIPENSDRDVSPLYLAELLRLIVGNAKPGNFTLLWQNIFGCTQEGNGDPQRLVDGVSDYLESYGTRESFIIWQIARNPRLDNQSAQLKHLLRAFESCLPNGLNAHRRAVEFDVEHLFARNYQAISSMSGHGFSGAPEYDQEFVDRSGNKLLLDASLNKAIKDTPCALKILAYGTGCYGSVQVAASAMTQSALQIAKDLQGVQQPQLLRSYVMLRQLRLAAFATNRF
jgi:hypothetical protein